MDPSISLQNEKIALQLKYLLALKEKASQQHIIPIINKLYPFTLYPLQRLPPLEMIEYAPNEQITYNLRELLQSYNLVIILGKCRAKKHIYYADEQKFIDESIREQLVYNFDEGETQLVALNSVVIIKIHKIWIKMAKKQVLNDIQTYIKKKLIQIPFFARLTFEEFSKLCGLAELKDLGPGQTLIQEGCVPYHMYIITQGELSLRKRVDFIDQNNIWREVQIQSQKKQDYCQELFEHLVRQPTLKSKTFNILFEIKSVGQGTVLCDAQTLNEHPLNYSLVSTLKTKYIAIKYPDLYVLEQSRLTDIRQSPSISIDKKQLRKQYYCQKNWGDYKRYLANDLQLSEMQVRKFEDFLRKEVNLSIKRYSYSKNKIGEGEVSDSPAEKMLRISDMAFQKT